MNYRVSKLIFKSISKTINGEEKLELENWLSNPKNESLYKRIIDRDAINEKLIINKQIDKDKVYRKIEAQITNKSKRRFFRVLKYAAIFIGVLGLTYISRNNFFEATDKLQIEDKKITLQLDDGTVKIIREEINAEIVDQFGNILGVQEGSQLVYNDSKTEESLVYNILKVPFGKKFELILSDGTKINLNAGTSLKYPVKFLSTGNRHVFLDGEAYFDVAEDRKHPFIVNADKLNIHVVGTKFNVTTYPEDENVDVALVEGKVGLYLEKDNAKYNSVENVSITSGYKGTYNKNSKQIFTEQVNTKTYTAWMEGELLYRNMPFKQILPKLQRHYNVTIINTNKALNEELFYASFKNEPIEKVLKYFNEIYQIQYNIENNQIIIK